MYNDPMDFITSTESNKAGAYAESASTRSTWGRIHYAVNPGVVSAAIKPTFPVSRLNLRPDLCVRETTPSFP